MANQSTPNKQKVPLSAVALYYKNLTIYFDAIADFNKVMPLYDSLDEGGFMRKELQEVYRKAYKCNPDNVRVKYKQYGDAIERDWKKVIKSLDGLRLPYTQEQIDEFRQLAEATKEQSDFRIRVRARVYRQYNNAQKEILRREQGLEKKDIYVDTPRKLIAWYREQRRKSAKKEA